MKSVLTAAVGAQVKPQSGNKQLAKLHATNAVFLFHTTQAESDVEYRVIKAHQEFLYEEGAVRALFANIFPLCHKF